MSSIAHELRIRGWTQGTAENEQGNVCLGGALVRASVGGVEVDRAFAAVRQAVKQHTLGASTGIVSFNDDPHTTYEDVLLVAKIADSILGETNGD